MEIQDIHIPVGAKVNCTDGLGGKSTCVLINPVADKVTHLVVQDAASHHLEYVVPVELVAAMSHDMIQLKCTRSELQHLDPFVQTHYIHEPMPQTEYNSGYANEIHLMWPYAVGDTMSWVHVNEQQIPLGELAVRRGTAVEATDGPVGHVDEFLVHPDTGNITHIVMSEGHLWGQKEVSIPISAIREGHGSDAVLLNLTKQQIEALPTIVIHRRQFSTP